MPKWEKVLSLYACEPDYWRLDGEWVQWTVMMSAGEWLAERLSKIKGEPARIFKTRPADNAFPLDMDLAGTWNDCMQNGDALIVANGWKTIAEEEKVQ